MLLQPTARLFQLQGSRRSLEDWAAGLWRIMQRGLQPLRTGPLRRLRQFFAPPDIGHAQGLMKHDIHANRAQTQPSHQMGHQFHIAKPGI